MNADEAPNHAQPRAVLKFGGEVVADSGALNRVLCEVAQLVEDGWRVIVVHGGGAQSTAAARQQGLAVRTVAGLRVTDEAALAVAKQVLAGSVNVDVVAAGVRAGLRALGICGVSLLRVRRRPAAIVDGKAVDYGWVGEVESVDAELLATLWGAGRVPVVAPLGLDARGRVYNVNADAVASALAVVVRADHLFLVTAGGGEGADRGDPASRIAALTPDQALAAIERGIIVGGMIPKVVEALSPLQRGVGAVHILGPELGALRAAASRPGSVGTLIGPSPGEMAQEARS